MGNRAAWNRVNKARKAEELKTCFEPLQARDPCQVAREDAAIAAKRESFPLH